MTNIRRKEGSKGTKKYAGAPLKEIDKYNYFSDRVQPIFCHKIIIANVYTPGLNQSSY